MKIIAILSLAILLVDCVLKEKLKSSGQSLLANKKGKKKVLVFTWNQGNNIPYNTQAQNKIRDRIIGMNPDLIVLGLQQAPTFDDKRDLSNTGTQIYPFLLQNYKKLPGSAYFAGNSTKQKKVYQALTVLVKSDDSTTKAEMKGYQTEKYSNKGFCQAEVTLSGKKLVFVSTRFQNSENKTTAVEKITEQVPKEYNAYFLMGDFNYRVSKIGASQDQQKLLTDMLAPKTRSTAINWYDSFKRSKIFEPLSIKWLDFDDKLNLPTYKRPKIEHGKKQSAHFKNIANLDTLDLLKTEKEKKELVKKVYFPLETKGKEWDFGWLDRIGYKVDGNNLKVSQDVKMQVWSDVPFSDHAPVVALFTISGF